MKRSTVRFKSLLLIAVFAGTATACQAGAATTKVVSSRTTRTTRTSTSVAHHRGGVSSHMALATKTLVSGAAERGTFVIVNRTSRPIHWACGYFDVQLTNAHHPLVVHPTPCSLHGKTLRVGTTRLPFTLRAGQAVCQGTCKALPPGTYHTQVFSGPKVAHPPAVTVHVVS